MVQEVQALNKRIEAINVQRTKAEAKVEMLKKQLVAAIGKYNETYGVNLGDKSFAKLSGKVKAELEKVSGALQVEFELKEKVVSAIENQQYDEAYRLLGVVPESDGMEEASVEDDGSEVTLDAQQKETSIVEASTEEGYVNFGDIDFGFEDDEDADEAGVVEEEPNASSGSSQTEKVKGESAVDAVESMDMVVEEDEIPNVDMDFGFGDMLSGTKFEA